MTAAPIIADTLSSAAPGGTSVVTIIKDSTARWLAILILGVIATYAAVQARTAYDMAQHADMNYTLVYTHLVKEDAWLQAHGVSTAQFGQLPQPAKDD